MITDDMDAICATLEQLTAAISTAVQVEDAEMVARVVQGRVPIITALIAIWQAADADEQARLAPRIERVLAEDDAIILAGTAWLREARGRLLTMRQGTHALRSYGAPYETLHRSPRH